MEVAASILAVLLGLMYLFHGVMIIRKREMQVQNASVIGLTTSPKRAPHPPGRHPHPPSSRRSATTRTTVTNATSPDGQDRLVTHDPATASIYRSSRRTEPLIRLRWLPSEERVFPFTRGFGLAR